MHAKTATPALISTQHTPKVPGSNPLLSAFRRWRARRALLRQAAENGHHSEAIARLRLVMNDKRADG
jgi:hypothetical protein